MHSSNNMTAVCSLLFSILISCTSILGQSEKMVIDGAIVIQNSEADPPAAGTIRWTGSDFEGFDGIEWVSLTTPALSGIITSGFTAPGLLCEPLGDVYDRFLNTDPIDNSFGSSQQASHLGWSEIRGIDLQVSAGDLPHGNMYLYKHPDKSMYLMLKNYFEQKTYTKLVLEVRDVIGRLKMKYTMENVSVIGYRHDAATVGEPPLEMFALAFDRLTFYYDQTPGISGGESEQCWDYVNKTTCPI